MDAYKQELLQRSYNSQVNNSLNNNNSNNDLRIRKTKHPFLGHFLIWGGFIIVITTLIVFAIVNTALKVPNNYTSTFSKNVIETANAEDSLIAQGLISPGDEPQKIRVQYDNETETNFAETNFNNNRNLLKTYLNFGLGIVGLLAVILLIIGPLIGFYILGSKVTEPGMELDPRSGKGPQSEVPNEIKGWNFGAFMFTPYWGMYYKLPASLLAFIPYVNIVVAFVYAIKGNEMAWKNQSWLSVHEFNHFKNKWNIVGLILFLFSIGVPLIFLILSTIF